MAHSYALIPSSVCFQYGSASGAVCKHIRRWVQHFTAKELEFYAIHFPKDPWKKLADICHFNPQKVGVLWSFYDLFELQVLIMSKY